MKKKYIKPSVFALTVPKDLQPEEGWEQVSGEQFAYIRNEAMRRILDKTYVANKDVVTRQVLDEWVLIPIGKEVDLNGIFSQNNVSHYLWKQFQEPVTVQHVIDCAHERFDDPNGRIEADVLRFVDEYTRYKLLMEVSSINE